MSPDQKPPYPRTIIARDGATAKPCLGLAHIVNCLLLSERLCNYDLESLVPRRYGRSDARVVWLTYDLAQEPCVSIPSGREPPCALDRWYTGCPGDSHALTDHRTPGYCDAILGQHHVWETAVAEDAI